MREILEKISDEMIKNFNFDCKSLNDAKKKINIDKLFVEYDAMTFDIYKTNLKQEEKKELYRIIGEKTKFNSEVVKERSERLILKKFIEVNNQYYDWEIEKTGRPDFILKKQNKRIGIEVTTFITEYEAVCHRIISDKTISRKSVEEYKSYAIKKHGAKANKYTYGIINGVRTLSTGTMDINYNKNCFVDIVNKKFIKYSGVALNYDKFIVLCYSNGIEIINEYDVKSFFDLIDRTIKRNISVGLLYHHNDKNVFCYDEMDF